MPAHLTVAAPVLLLTEEDHQLIDRARRAFRRDYRYLEQVLWQARARRSTPDADPATLDGYGS